MPKSVKLWARTIVTVAMPAINWKIQLFTARLKRNIGSHLIPRVGKRWAKQPGGNFIFTYRGTQRGRLRLKLQHPSPKAAAFAVSVISPGCPVD